VIVGIFILVSGIHYETVIAPEPVPKDGKIRRSGAGAIEY